MEVDKRKQAEEALQRAQQRAKSYAGEKRAKGVNDINPNTYNVLYSAIIVLTLNDLRQNPLVVDWVAAGAALGEAPLQALGASSLLMAYALFQLLFSFGEAGTSAPFRFAVNRLGFTEPPFSSLLNDEKREGDYLCSGCGVKLFDSSAKFDSGSGWPAFWRTHDGRLTYKKELDGRMEVRCGMCDSHLGHVFSDGPDVLPGDSAPDTDPGGAAASFSLNDDAVHPRFCINGCALDFQEHQEPVSARATTRE